MARCLPAALIVLVGAVIFALFVRWVLTGSP